MKAGEVRKIMRISRSTPHKYLSTQVCKRGVVRRKKKIGKEELGYIQKGY